MSAALHLATAILRKVEFVSVLLKNKLIDISAKSENQIWISDWNLLGYYLLYHIDSIGRHKFVVL